MPNDTLKMKQRMGCQLKAGDYIMVDNELALVAVNDLPYLVITKFAQGQYGPREVHKIAQDEYYFVPSKEFIYGLGALSEDEVLSHPEDYLFLLDGK